MWYYELDTLYGKPGCNVELQMVKRKDVEAC